MFVELGHFALIMALAVALLQATVPLWGAHARHPQAMALAGPAANLQLVLVVIAYAALTAPLAVALGPGLNRLGAALVLTGLYGAGLEVAQMVGDAGREGSLLDIAANLSGAMAGLVLVAILRGDRPLFRRDNC